jgi:hypothetical protein
MARNPRVGDPADASVPALPGDVLAVPRCPVSGAPLRLSPAAPVAEPAEPALTFHARAPDCFQSLGQSVRIARRTARSAEVLRTHVRGPRFVALTPRCGCPG